MEWFLLFRFVYGLLCCDHMAYLKPFCLSKPMVIRNNRGEQHIHIQSLNLTAMSSFSNFDVLPRVRWCLFFWVFIESDLVFSLLDLLLHVALLFLLKAVCF